MANFIVLLVSKYHSLTLSSLSGIAGSVFLSVWTKNHGYPNISAQKILDFLHFLHIVSTLRQDISATTCPLAKNLGIFNTYSPRAVDCAQSRRSVLKTSFRFMSMENRKIRKMTLGSLLQGPADAAHARDDLPTPTLQ